MGLLNLFSEKTKSVVRFACLWLAVAACERGSPRVEPDPLPSQPMDPKWAQRLPVGDPAIWGLLPQAGSSYLNASLQLLARVYAEEIAQTGNRPLQALLACLKQEKERGQDACVPLLRSWKQTLPEPYKSSREEADVTAFLRRLHQDCPFLGAIECATGTALAARSGWPSRSYADRRTIPMLELQPPLTQKASEVDLPTLLQAKANQGSAVLSLPEKLCVALERRPSRAQQGSDWNAVDVTGAGSISLRQEAAPWARECTFDLVAFLVSAARVAGRNLPSERTTVLFFRSGDAWHAIHNEHAVPVAAAEALRASRQGSLFFYRKRAGTN